MRSVLKTAVFSVLMLVAGQGSARAAGIEVFLDFIDHLSGPGPFSGPGMGMVIFCDRKPRVGRAACWQTVPPSDRSNGPINRFEIGPEVSFVAGVINDDLAYPASKDSVNKRVNAQTVGVFGNYWVNNWLGLSARATAVRFSFDKDLTASGDGSVWSSVYSVGPIFRLNALHPVSIDIIPLAQFGLGPFEASDFGALGPRLGSDTVKLGFHIGVHF